ncbi:two pore domain potassium channel family protein [Bacillus sp. FJAT-50079]|uniref:two pore domain potassium channel family protein n=1 Tax=Bacillus sp. FJAT-50079 TaxID=2833577 RepID=UPI001BC9D3FE|nr:two pore domain potassium channel family protein [Bacillus sp. FJAT-50079]MBS4209115.1 two pore domain potassium channel family protein [Bacillus sp. FJAT-50079]
MWYVILLAIMICIVMALRTLFFPARFSYKQVSFENFVFLGYTYAIIMLGFGLIFLMLKIKGYVVFIEPEELASTSWIEQLGTSIYLSGITLFSVGYGDIVPVGIGRFLVIVEALLGYTIPAAFVVRSFIDYDPTN